MARPSLPTKEVKKAIITVRAKSEEHEALLKYCEERNITIAQLFRERFSDVLMSA
ncbi:hypothetical protein [Trichormus variabilis]|uniref:CopG family transcriptional regulator n=1 Tax=Trichormus variabilis NIES-23 TaxID=1973479 RepID=A0A1Z4KXG4_ANAVA|nr:hypothetical protein [Trichormus variabilis]MBD2352837.1 hypothetical protein [Trichormus variabilis FACHB-171]BAY73582.1 hypothetical protein NIES23_64340 [Trichormus variabilis NIES-23]